MYVKMWPVYCCLLVLISFEAGVQGKRNSTETLNPYKIWGGTKARDYSYPYLASLQWEKSRKWKHFCGAVLIAPQKLVTAAHCLYQNSKPIRIKIGAMDIEKDGPKNMYSQIREVRTISIHPRYQKPGERNDIAVIYLTSPISYNTNVNVANLAPKGKNFEGERCVIAGWGISEESPQGSSYLREAYTWAMSTYACDEFQWGEPGISINEICVFDENQDPNYRPRTCRGDSGGALMCGKNFGFLAGVTSIGGKNCTGDFPSLFTRISEYIQWIKTA